jgi:hypothetical protein
MSSAVGYPWGELLGIHKHEPLWLRHCFSTSLQPAREAGL